MKQQIQCPNCKTYKTINKRARQFNAGLFSIFIATPISAVFIITIFLTPIFLLVGVVILFSGFFVSRKIWICRNCKNEFII